MTEDIPSPRPLTDSELDQVLRAANANLLEWVKTQGGPAEMMEGLATRALEYATEASAYQAKAEQMAQQAAYHARRARNYAIVASLLSMVSVFFAVYAILT